MEALKAEERQEELFSVILQNIASFACQLPEEMQPASASKLLTPQPVSLSRALHSRLCEVCDSQCCLPDSASLNFLGCQERTLENL